MAIYPGAVYYSKFLTAEVLDDNEYMISRYDNTVIDGRDWCRRAFDMHQVSTQHVTNSTHTFEQTIKRFRNPFGIGNIINHPPPGKLPNVLQIGYDFTDRGPTALPNHLQAYIPNEIFKPSRLGKRLDTLVQSVVLVATKHLHNEELFVNYRFNPSNPYPSWYVQPDEEEARRRWSEPPFWRRF
jgi:hypothetical protein